MGPPGHVNFVDEAASAIRLVDGILLVVDSILRYALQEGMKITFVVDQIGRLILELRIKPTDVYYKIQHTVEEINTIRPEMWCGSTSCSALRINLDFHTEGDIYFNSETVKFTRKPTSPKHTRIFVTFIVEPLYKLYSHVLSQETEDLKETSRGFGIQLKLVIYKMDVRPLLKIILD
ncbi:hypothetical protein C0992_000686 [Termitomyces sp. T32_za158]|nr:hypothetical protein C0992_000686 [Termitomyces sp. T32_za158]